MVFGRPLLIVVACANIFLASGFSAMPGAGVIGYRPLSPGGGGLVPSRVPHRAAHPATTRLEMDSTRSGMEGSGFPVIKVPVGFEEPTPRPFQPTGDLVGLLTSALAMVARLGAGVCVLGYKAWLSLSPPEDQEEYCLRIGPLYLRESSPFMRRECPRPQGRLILYEFDSSPFCRKVRDACAILDLEVDIRPCPGALEGGHFSDEHLKLHGKRTVPYLIDEGENM